MNGRGIRIAGAILAGLISIAAAAYSGVLEQQRLLLLAREVPSQLVPIAAAALPKGAALLPPSAPLTPAQRRTIARALWRDPLDVETFNLVYADGVRSNGPADELARDATLLARLGWRFTPAQENLIIWAANHAEYGNALDRVDALIRRQKLFELDYAVLSAMEAAPQMHAAVVTKLVSGAPWRQNYLAVITPTAPQALLEQRIRTLQALLAAPRPPSSAELAPSLVALSASGHAREAYGLWRQAVNTDRTPALIYDPHFVQAGSAADPSNPAVPFEWKLGGGIGFSVQPSSDGVAVDWDRHGVPVFLSQLVPVRPGQSYALVIKGDAGSNATLASLLAPTISCGDQHLSPGPHQDGRHQADYVFSALPSGCDMGLLTVSGAVDAGYGKVDFALSEIELIQQ